MTTQKISPKALPYSYSLLGKYIPKIILLGCCLYLDLKPLSNQV